MAFFYTFVTYYPQMMNTMKKLYFDFLSQRKRVLSFLKTLLLLISVSSFSQTTLINPNADGGFENGNTVASNGWTAVNATTDSWNVGNVPVSSLGVNCAFISSNGGTSWQYSQTSSVVHLFKQVAIPTNQPKITLSFRWKAGGEGTGTNDWDNMKVFLVPASYNPTVGVPVPPSYQVGTLYKLSPTNWNTANISLAIVPGASYKLVFSWKSDILDVVNPPAAIDQVSMISNPPGNFTSITSGNWNSPATWDANAVPTSSDNAIISAADIVTLNVNNLVINDLTVNGTLNYAAAAATFAVKGNLLVNTGGNLNAFAAAVGKSLVVSRDFTNNGNIDLSKGTAVTNILTFDGIIPQTVGGSGTFTNNVIRNLTFNNSSTGTITWNFNDIRVGGNLNFTKGRVALGTNTLTLGTGIAAGTGNNAIGALVYTSGGFVSGTFSRWWANATAGTALTSGNLPIAVLGRYPFVSNSGSNRAAYVQRATPTAGGQIACKYVDAATVSASSISDAGYAVDSRYDGNWTFSTPGTVPTSATYNVALIGQNAYLASNGNSRITRATTSVEGTQLTGTNLPVAQRTGLTLSQLIQEPLYIGLGFADTPNSSTASGNWNDVSIWSKGNVPACNEVVSIAPGHSVTINSAANVCKSLNISLGSTLAVSSGDLVVGCTDNNNTLNVLGTLNVTGGTLNVNGNISTSYGSVFSQSGGNINVDGNSGVTATSVANGTRIINIVPEDSESLNWTGGTLTIVDPHLSTTANDVLRLDGAFEGSVNVTANHTIRFGNGTSTQAGGNATNGFRVNCWATITGLPLGNVIVEGPSGTNRYLTSTYQLPIYGNLTINDGAEARVSTIYLNGNANINSGGTLTSTTGFFFVNARFIDESTVSFNPSLNPQQITNNGTIRNLAVAPTANFSNVVVNNASATGLTLNSPLSLSGTLTLNEGKINTSNTNLLTIGTATTGGDVAGGSATAYVNGPLSRTFPASRTAVGTYSGVTIYPLGKNGNYLPIHIDASTSAGPIQMKAEVYDTNSGTFPANIAALSNNRWETSFVSGNENFLNANVRITDTGIVSNSKMLKSPTATGQYAIFSPVSTVASGTLTTYAPIAASDFTGFFSHGQVICTGTVTAPTGSPLQDFFTNQTLANFTVSGTDIIWYDAETGGNMLPQSTLIVSGVTYYASQTINGCESILRLAVTAGEDLGTEDFENTFFKYYPNPVENILNMDSSSEVIQAVEIYNLLGQKILDKTLDSMQAQIDLSSLSKGTYILKIQIGDFVKSLKILKK